jgi:hypothetical protein
MWIRNLFDPGSGIEKFWSGINIPDPQQVPSVQSWSQYGAARCLIPVLWNRIQSGSDPQHCAGSGSVSLSPFSLQCWQIFLIFPTQVGSAYRSTRCDAVPDPDRHPIEIGFTGTASFETSIFVASDPAIGPSNIISLKLSSTVPWTWTLEFFF